MLTIVIGIVKKSPGLIINRNVTTYDEYHPGLFQMQLEFWQGLYSSYRCILFIKSVEQRLFEKLIVVKMVKKCYITKNFCVLHVQSNTTIVVFDCTCNTQKIFVIEPTQWG